MPTDNGWTNWPTEHAALIIDNTYSLYKFCYESAANMQPDHLAKVLAIAMAHAIRTKVVQGFTAKEGAAVNWYEVAAHIISCIKEEGYNDDC